MVGLAERLPIGSGNMAFDFKLKRTLRGLSEPAGLWNPVWLAPASAHEIEMLTGERVKNEDLLGEAFELWESCESTDMTDRTIEFFANFYLQQILTKVDRASMLCSLEVRSPFLDPDLADYALSLPASAKFRHGQGKVVLRRALTGHLDNRILRRKKKGFGIPLVEWLRRLPLPDLSRAEDLGIDPSAFAKMWQAHRDGVADHRGALWAVLTLLESGLRGSEERSPVT